jgi:hypothetical protein
VYEFVRWFLLGAPGDQISGGCSSVGGCEDTGSPDSGRRSPRWSDEPACCKIRSFVACMRSSESGRCTLQYSSFGLLDSKVRRRVSLNEHHVFNSFSLFYARIMI